eukprot:gene7561-9840_t
MGVTDMLRGGCPVLRDDQPQDSSCSTDETSKSESINPNNQMLLQEKQSATIGQSKPLATDREVSTIPKSEFTPSHQNEGDQHWQYPSQQMFYNAMKRKGWNPMEDDMPAVVAIHNSVNETAWRQIKAWEALHSETAEEVKLSRFMGRPRDVSPKAFFRSLLGQERPFDRHDWYVKRGNREVRYVIDFYNVRQNREDEPVAVYIDARPALDTPLSIFDRLRMSVSRIFSETSTTLKGSAYVPTVTSTTTNSKSTQQ